MVQFAQKPIIEEGIDDLVSDQEKRKRIKKALEIHMLENREAHMKPHSHKESQFGKAFGTEEEKEQKPIQQKQQEQQWETDQPNQQSNPVRTCPCCVKFLKNTFGMDDKEVNNAIGGADGGPVGYQGGGGSGEAGYGTSGRGDNSYAGASGASYSGSSDSDSGTKYAGQKPGY